jgi:hypothetical protein
LSGSLTPPSTHAAQALLRTDPAAATTKYGFRVESSVYTAGTLGGPCALICSEVGGNIYQLRAQQGSGDFFFPYVGPDKGGVGVCIVPMGQRDGVMVVTGGMNGCALQVNWSDNSFYFYHDTDGKNLRNKLTPGEVICSVNYDQYAGADKLGEKKVEESRKDKGGYFGYYSLYYEYYLITVRRKGMWQVYASALMRTTARKREFGILGEFKTETKYNSFKPKQVTLVSQFPDKAPDEKGRWT